MSQGLTNIKCFCRHLPDIESVVKVQQGLQQAYCAKAVKEGKLGIMEPNAMGYTAGATYRQLHGAPIGFSDTSKMVRERIAPIPDQQLFVQMHSAMCNLGMSFEEFATMKEPSKVFDFLRATFAASIQVCADFMYPWSEVGRFVNTFRVEQDSKQNVYQSDYVLHSVQVVSMEVAMANLQPVPGLVEYAPGCTACFYRQHVLPGTNEKIYCRCCVSLVQSLSLGRKHDGSFCAGTT